MRTELRKPSEGDFIDRTIEKIGGGPNVLEFYFTDGHKVAVWAYPDPNVLTGAALGVNENPYNYRSSRLRQQHKEANRKSP